MIAAAKNIVKSYRDSDQEIQVLRGCNLEIMPQDFILISGKSGCGKSTLLHILGLLDAPDSGAIYINGKKVSSLSSDAASLRNLHLGFVFQFHYLVEDLTAAENIALPQMIAGTSSGKAISHARDMLKRLELDALWQRYPNQLSGGEQQRIALARALINEPKLVLADEPSGNLDPVNSAGIWELMKELNRDLGQAFVIVTHDSDTASKSNKRFELSQGVLSPL